MTNSHSMMEQFFLVQLAALLNTAPTSMEMHSLSLKPAGGLGLPPDMLLIEVLLLGIDLSYDTIVDKLLGSVLEAKLGVFKIERVKPQHFNEGGSAGTWIDIRASR